MKNNKFLITICAMVVAIIISITVVSCKKETQGNLMNNKNESVQTFNPREIEDMNAYLKGFKQKMQSATKGDDEALSLEDAAWHLSSLANYEFANANVEYDDVRFDTLYANVNIINGTILLSDLAETYQTVSSNIEKFYNGLALDNKHFRFINAFIFENGDIAIPLLTTFSHGSKYITDHCWYFNDVFSAFDSCALYFPDSEYPVKTTGTSELLNRLYLTFSHPYSTNIHHPSTTIYYTYASERLFDYRSYIDSYWSPFFNNSRVFSCNYTDNYTLELDHMCYLLDSYLGLAIQYCPSGQEIVGWSVIYKNETYPRYMEFHEFKAIYGIRHEIPPQPGSGEYD